MRMAIFAAEHVVQVGTYLYDGQVECDLRIVFSPVRYRSGAPVVCYLGRNMVSIGLLNSAAMANANERLGS